MRQIVQWRIKEWLEFKCDFQNPEEVDEDFDFEETMRAIHAEINELNAEAAELAERIAGNFEELGI